MAKSGYKRKPQGDYRFLIIVAVALFLAFIVNAFFYSNTRVVGNSMAPLLQENNWIIVDRRAYRQTSPAFGDIVVVYKPDVTGEPIIKRIMGLPLDTLEIRAGKFYRNGREIHDFSKMDSWETMKSVTVPKGCYFLMGDNRRASNDSRRWKNPFVRKDQIAGKVLFRYFPGYLNLRQT
jgi:signal peptidase I